ncbi:MAG TPA: MBL fold metallo-hydrolase [Jatrophihabitantaceae bacterium]|jgi:L-ascorbate metabolism protein UlaG (beta-lactamase superfamily)|nr:MBL fold metallo-hydrolase [Jatrophihabitantaceae bacterium]
MQLTKYTHACVRLDDGDRGVVIDPGVYSEVDEAVDGAAAILITHEHPDHIDVENVRAALGRDSRLRLYAPTSVAATLADLGEQVVAVQPGEQFEAAGFSVRSFGGQHALIHPAIQTIANLGYLVDGAVYHPGDSFTVPNAPVTTLLLPSNAPWSKASEVIDFAIAVRAPRVHQIHDSLVTDVYAGMVEGHLGRIAGPHGVQFQHLRPKETVTL